MYHIAGNLEMRHIHKPSTDNTLLPVPWTPQDVGRGMLFFVGWFLIVILLGEVNRLANLALDPSVIIIFGTALLLLPVWYFSFHKYHTGWAELGLRPFGMWAVGLGCGLMVASLLFNFIYAAILAIFNLRIQPDITIMFHSTRYPFLLLLGGAFVAPFVEEVFFRGFVFSGLQKRWGWEMAAVISAGLFALAHVVPTSVVPIFILGLIFAYLYRVSGSIWPAIFMHMLTNAVALSAAYAVAQGWVPSP